MSPMERAALEVELQRAIDTHLSLRLFDFDNHCYFVQHMSKPATGEIAAENQLSPKPDLAAIAICSGFRLGYQRPNSLWLVGVNPARVGATSYRYVLVESYGSESPEPDPTCWVLKGVRETNAYQLADLGFSPRYIINEYAKYAVRNMNEAEKKARDFRLLVGAIANDPHTDRGMLM